MQGLATQRIEGLARLGLQAIRLGAEGRAVDRIPEQGVAAMREMHADLVGPSGLEPQRTRPTGSCAPSLASMP